MATQTVPESAMPDPPATTNLSKPDRPPITVTKPNPYIFDLGHLLALDPNPLPPTTSLLQPPQSTRSDEILDAAARDGAQSLLNTLLTTQPIANTSNGLILTLPNPTTVLPRWKPLPKPKPPTKWERFAKKKGVGKFGTAASGGAKLQERRKNLVYNEEKGEWVPRWGYKGKNKDADTEWAVEVDESKAAGTGAKGKGGGKGKGAPSDGDDVRNLPKRERMEKMRRQDRRERRNQKNERAQTS